MTLATEMKKRLDNKAVHAAAGAGDLAVEKLRELPERLQQLQNRTDVRELPEKAREYAANLRARAERLYDDLAARGKSVVQRVSDQAATQQLEQSARTTARKAGQTADSAKATAKAAGKAVTTGAKKVGD